MNRGFTQTVIDAIKSADPRHIGVRLGLLMIEKRMSTSEAAEILQLSRNSVHTMIKGKRWPRQDAALRVEALIEKLQNQ